MKRYSILSLLFIFFALGVVAQVDSLILPFGATTLTGEQKASNPDYLAYPLMLASQMPEIKCNQIIDCMEPVDLGLSVMWATCNVGAEKPEDYGDYFAWGEVKTKAMYDFATYKYFKGTSTMTPDVTKYCDISLSGYKGFVDNKFVVDPEDDAATVNWGGEWRIPTDAELTELREKCTWIWTVQNGVNGYKVTGPNGNSIFLPAVGYINNERFVDLGKGARYWSSSLELNGGSVAAYSVSFSSNSVVQSIILRTCGQPVRPVCPKKQEHEWVDLGLSVKWATCNVGAEKSEDYGDYFAWGETEPKENYDWTTYKYCKGTNKTMTKYCNNSSYGNGGFTDTKTVLDPEDDAATANWGGAWRMPTRTEQDELINNCTWTWTTQNGVNGYKVVGPNGNSIFLPAAGYRNGTSLDDVGSHGCYWSSSLAFLPCFACRVYGALESFEGRSFGLSVRPVCP